jgi:large repetitive protein
LDAILFNYNFGGYGSSADPNPVFSFSDEYPGSYSVMLTVTNQYGCSDSISYMVVIDGIYTLYAPNAFSPNGDGINDIFYVSGDGFDAENFELSIYNRWGELIFSSETISTGWDGMHNGQKVSGDVYVWKIVSKDRFTKQQYEKFGHVTVVK